MSRLDMDIGIFPDTGEVLTAAAIREMSADDFTVLRARIADHAAHVRRGTEACALVVCPYCDRPLFLTYAGNQYERNIQCMRHGQNDAEACQHAAQPLSADSLRALKWNGAEEGADHRDIKNHLADMLSLQADVTEIAKERIIRGRYLDREYRRPDVQCLWRDRRVVFEVQLSHTVITDIADRRTFYDAEDIWLIWVFLNPDFSRALAADEFRLNWHNLFEVTVASRGASSEQQRLVLACRHEPEVPAGRAKRPEHAISLVGLEELTWTNSSRAYFRDGRDRAEAAEDELDELSLPEPDRPKSMPRFISERARQALDEQVEPAWRRQLLETAVARGMADLPGGKSVAWSRAFDALPDPQLRSLAERVLEREESRLMKLVSVGLDGVLEGGAKASFSVYSSITLGANTQRYPVGLVAAEIAEVYPPEWKAEQRQKHQNFLAEARSAFDAASPLQPWTAPLVFLAAVLFPLAAPAIARIRGSMLDAPTDLRWHSPTGAARERALKQIQDFNKQTPRIDWKVVYNDLHAAMAAQQPPDLAVVTVAARHGSTPKRVAAFAHAVGRVTYA